MRHYPIIATKPELQAMRFKHYPMFLDGLGRVHSDDRMFKIEGMRYHEYQYIRDGIWGFVYDMPLNVFRR